MAEREHIIYRYMVDGKPIYIGKTNSSLYNRITGHRGEAKFRKYLDEATIEYCVLGNTTEVDVMERLLINKYKPILNAVDNHDESCGIEFSEPKRWKKYDEYLSSMRTNQKNLTTEEIRVKKIRQKAQERRIKKIEIQKKKIERTKLVFHEIYKAAMAGNESCTMFINEEVDLADTYFHGDIFYPMFVIECSGGAFASHNYDSFTIERYPNKYIYTWSNDDHVLTTSIIDCFKYLMDNGENYVETDHNVFVRYKEWRKKILNEDFLR